MQQSQSPGSLHHWRGGEDVLAGVVEFVTRLGRRYNASDQVATSSSQQTWDTKPVGWKELSADRIPFVPVESNGSPFGSQKHKTCEQGRSLVRRQNEAVVVPVQRLPVALLCDRVMHIRPVFPLKLVREPGLNQRVDGAEAFFGPDLVEAEADMLDAVVHRQQLLLGSNFFLVHLLELPRP